MNYWKTSALALTLALGVVAGGAFVKPAAAETAPDAQLASALEHLKAAKTALKNAEQRHRHAHRAAVVATDFAIAAVEKEIAWEGRQPTPKDPKDPTPKDPRDPTPKDPRTPTPKSP